MSLFGTMPPWAGVLAVLTAAALFVWASPVFVVLAFLALAAGLVFLVVRVFGRGSIRRPVMLCTAAFAAIVVASGLSSVLYPGLVERVGIGNSPTVGGMGTGSTAASSTEVTMIRAVDGDTVEISPAIDGIEDVRLIGMDTPETSGDCGTEPLAETAEDYTARYAGGRLTLEFDEERTDRYGRLLAYVYMADGEMLNEELVREGLAQVATFPPNVRHEEDFLEAQVRAREESAGIWGLSPGQQELLTDRGNGIGGGC